MARVNLAKALKMKNALVGELNRLKEILTRENSRQTTTTSTVDRQKVWEEIMQKTAELVVLKTSIATANVGLYQFLASMEETRSLITLLKSLNTTDGVQHVENRFGTVPPTQVTYSAFFTLEKIDAEVKQGTKLIEAYQDQVDEYNAKTFIEV